MIKACDGKLSRQIIYLDLEGSGAKGKMQIKKTREMIVVTKLGPGLTRKSSVNVRLVSAEKR